MPDGELVFVSYSHKDAAWAQRFAVLLKPLLRRRRIRLWMDGTALRGGDEWLPEIQAAIAQSAAALILVSADYLDSDFVMDEELPALVRHGVRLLPVLVGDCLWPEEPTLAHRHWLHDLTDGALGRDAGDPGLVDKRLTAMCWKLLEVLPGTSAAEPEPVATPGPREVAEVPAGPSAGALSGVPDAPPGYVVRDELAALIEAVTATDTGGAIGVTAEAPVGLVGQGGIGKSVLAAALGCDERIRYRFPDGVFWVTVGERPDLLAVQLDLLARVGDAGAAPRSIHDATARLRDLLRARRVLLLVDDVWSDAAADAFRVTGPQGRVVYTTRERQVVAAVGAREYPIGVLSPGAARAVAAAVLGRPADALPAVADHAFEQVGHVALSVALLAAAVRGGRSWDAVADALRHEVDVYGDHPYANTFKAMQIGVAALSADLAAALLGLAVFPPDTAVPVAAVARYWAHTRGPDVDTSADLDRLAAANVLRRDGDEIGFHDLQHDYLLLHSAGLPTLHADLLDAYRALLPDGRRAGWWRLPPDEPYVWDHLVAHLAGAGERKALAETATDPAYLARRIDGGGLHAAEADLARAAEVLPEHSLVAWWQRWLARHSAFLAAAGRRSVTPTMLAWLQADPTRPAGIEPDRLLPVLPSPYLAVRWGLSSPEPALVRALTGHRADVWAVDWSPDGTLVASGAEDGEVRLSNPDTGDTVAVLQIGDNAVIKVAWSPDSQRIAVVTRSEAVVYDVQGHLVEPLHNTGYGDLAWSPDGRRLAIVGGLFRGGELHLYDALDTRPTRLVLPHEGMLLHVAWSADGRSVATADHAGRVALWDAASGRCTGVTHEFAGGVRALSWSPRSGALAVAGGDALHLWRPAGDDPAAVLGRHLDIQSVAWSASGDRVASAGRDVRVWGPGRGRSVGLGSHTSGVRSMAWSPDGGRLATAGGDREVQLWDTTATSHDVFCEPSPGWVLAVAVCPEGRHLATLSDERLGRSPTVQVWDNADRRADPVTVTVPTTGTGDALSWSDDGGLLHVAGPRSARRWDRITGEVTVVRGASIGGNGFWPTIAWARGGRRFAVALHDRIETWSDDEPGPTATLSYAGAAAVLSWSADGTRLAACGASPPGAACEIVVWQLGDDQICARLRLRIGPQPLLAWSSDNSWLAVVQHRLLILWEPATGTTVTLVDRLDTATGVAWSPDGRHVVTTHEGGTVTVHPVDGSAGSGLQLAGANCIAWEGSTIAVGQRTGPAVLELRTP